VKLDTNVMLARHLMIAALKDAAIAVAALSMHHRMSQSTSTHISEMACARTALIARCTVTGLTALFLSPFQIQIMKNGSV
jgi:hypothetical protein